MEIRIPPVLDFRKLIADMARGLFLLGPTGVGKSELALELARATGAEIVNADAFQMYRGLDLGTAKPEARIRAQWTHHLFDVLDPREFCSAGEYARWARQVLTEVFGRGRSAIVVGGTGFYVRALRQGLHELPEVPPSVREELRRRLASEGLARLRQELHQIDEASWKRIHPHDTQRTLRALEIYEVSGRPWSEWLKSGIRTSNLLAGEFLGIRLTCSRPVLYDRIRARLDKLIASGWVEEVEGLLREGVPPEAPGFRAIGYREWIDFLRGRRKFEAARQEVLRATLRYAKRQETWFRREAELRPVTRESAPEEFDHWVKWLVNQ